MRWSFLSCINIKGYRVSVTEHLFCIARHWTGCMGSRDLFTNWWKWEKFCVSILLWGLVRRYSKSLYASHNLVEAYANHNCFSFEILDTSHLSCNKKTIIHWKGLYSLFCKGCENIWSVASNFLFLQPSFSSFLRSTLKKSLPPASFPSPVPFTLYLSLSLLGCLSLSIAGFLLDSHQRSSCADNLLTGEISEWSSTKLQTPMTVSPAPITKPTNCVEIHPTQLVRRHVHVRTFIRTHAERVLLICFH